MIYSLYLHRKLYRLFKIHEWRMIFGCYFSPRMRDTDLKLTPWSRALLQKLRAHQLVKYHKRFRKGRFIAILTVAGLLFLSLAKQSMPLRVSQPEFCRHFSFPKNLQLAWPSSSSLMWSQCTKLIACSSARHGAGLMWRTKEMGSCYVDQLQIFYILLTVHLGTFRVNNQRALF